ncbi:hypothetical protein CL631_02040 [bacterium]|jgi:hypothetical protein|nr:hypothetical protein [bacterium]|tara:strand:+ start:21457 stop:21708 length:252 start_codon:yes stop_codon:yes gene_type:complete
MPWLKLKPVRPDDIRWGYSERDRFVMRLKRRGWKVILQEGERVCLRKYCEVDGERTCAVSMEVVDGYPFSRVAEINLQPLAVH